MKYLVVLCLVVVAVCGLPARKTDYDDSEESFFLFPMGRQQKKDVRPVVEVDMGDSDEDDSFFPSYFKPFIFNPFSFLNLAYSDFFSKPSWFDSFFPKMGPHDVVKNSTSTTQVVNGHKITINETTYQNEKDGSVYQHKIINVEPVHSIEEGDKPSEKEPEQTEEPLIPDVRIQTTENVKPDQNSQDNEIHREEMFERYELQGDDSSVYDKNVEVIEVDNNHLRKRDNVDLSGDIRINALRAENARRGGLYEIPADVEVFDPIDYEALSANYQQQQPVDAQEIIRPSFKQEEARSQSRFVPSQENQKIVPPQYNQQVVPAQYNQQVVPAQYNQQKPAQYNQQIPAQYNQQVPAQYNQQVVRPQYNQQVVPAQYNQQTPAQYNQQVVPAQYNQQVVPAQYNQQVVPAQYNQQKPAQYNQQIPAQYNQQVPAQYNQQVVRPQYNQQQM